MLHYSGDFEADPDFCAGVLYRVPMPALPTENFGIFVQGAAAHIDRDIPEYYENRDGIFYTFTAGVDFTIARGKNLFLTAQLGAVYAAYGDIKGVDDGWGVHLGLMGGLRTTFFRPDSKVYITYNPQMAIDGSDWFVVHALGLLFAF